MFVRTVFVAVWCVHAVTGAAAERPEPVVTYHLGFENVEFFTDDFVHQSGRKSITDRNIDFPEGRFGRGIRMNYVPRVPDADNMSGIDLDLVTAVMFNTMNFPEMGFNEPFFWGSGRLNARIGAVAFWAKGKPPFPGPLFEQTSVAFGRLERDLIGIVIDADNCLRAYLRDARYVRHELYTVDEWDPGRWNHIVFNWDWAEGLELWLNGKKIVSSKGGDSWFDAMYPGLLHLPSAGMIYDELYLLDRPLTGSEIERLYESNMPPGIETPRFNRTANDYSRIAQCSGADDPSGLYAVNPDSRLVVTEVFPLDAGDGHIPGWYVIDGRNEMAWPHEYAFFTIIPGDADFHAEKVDLTIPPDAQVNYVVLTGNLSEVRVQAGANDTPDLRDLFTVPPGDRFLYGAKVKTVGGETIRIPFTTGYGTPPGFEGDVYLPLSGEKRIQEVSLYNVAPSDTAPGGMRLKVTEAVKPLEERYAFALRALASRDERRTAVASSLVPQTVQSRINIGGFRRLNIFSEPFVKETGVTALTLSLPVKTGMGDEVLYVRVHDPAVPSRMWNQFALLLKGFDGGFRRLVLTIDFTDLVLTGGDRLWVDIGSAGKCEVKLGDPDDSSELLYETTASYIAVDSYADKEIVSAKTQYAKMYEYMPWKFSGKAVKLEHPYAYGGPFDIILPALAVLRVKPDHFVARFMELMCGPSYTNSGDPADVAAVEPKTLSGPPGAPEWAVYMRDYNTVRHTIAGWWADNQNPDGQVGGGWNDDTLFLSFHMPDLPLDSNAKARALIDTVHTRMEATGLFRDGYCRIHPIDRLHTGDFISERYNTVVNNIGQAYAIEREMETAWHAGHPERTPLNYGKGEAFLSSVNVLNWYWGLDIPTEPYVSNPLPEVTKSLRLFASTQNDYTFYRYTASHVHSDDYSPYGSSEIFRYLLGGPEGSRWDAHVRLAVMWPSGGGPDVARVVLRADNRSLEALCYSFCGTKRDCVMRLCRIQDGRYRVTLRTDPTGTGVAGAVLWETEKDLRRFDVIAIPVPPGTPCIIRVEQVEWKDRPSAMPDLVIDPWDANRSGKDVTVRVHNIGNAPARNIVVRLLDGGAVIGERTIEMLDAPVDYIPKRSVVTFEGVRSSADLNVVVDPDNTIREILDDNNTAPVRN